MPGAPKEAMLSVKLISFAASESAMCLLHLDSLTMLLVSATLERAAHKLRGALGTRNAGPE